MTAEITTAPCGCRFGVVDEAFVIEPCAINCPTYGYVLEQSKALQQPVEFATPATAPAGWRPSRRDRRRRR